MPAGGTQKVIYALASPYSAPVWPEISSSLEQSLVDLLTPIIEVIGKPKSIAVSKRNRNKKRKTPTINHGDPFEQNDHSDPHPVTVGFNSTVHRLEVLIQSTNKHNEGKEERTEQSSSLCAVFVAHSSLPSILTASLPVLAAMASAAEPEEPAVRLIPVTERSALQLARTLNQPRLGVLGLARHSEQSAGLEKLITESTKPIEIPRIHRETSENYLPVKIHKQDATPDPGKRGKKRSRTELKTS